MKQHAVRLFVMLALLCLGMMAFAQSDTARLVGTVTDPTGAAIPGATIAVRNLGTNRVISATSNSTGDYTVNALPPGKYHVEIKKESFGTESADFALDISQVQEINFKLKVGGASDVVNVTDELPLVQTSTSSSGEIIQGRQVTELPLNGRNFTQLALLTPGVTRGAYGDGATGGSSGTSSETWRNHESGGGALSVNGLRPQANNFIMDGVDNNESLVNTLLFFPPAEAIQEFRVNTSVAPAEFGVAGGAIVQVQTKQGTNDIHGSAFWFNRPHPLDADPWNQTTYQPYVRNQFGGTLGAPIWKNKLFAFFDYQGWREDIPVVDGPTHVPTLLERQGNFSELLGGNQTSVPVQQLCPNLYSGGTLLPQFAPSMGYIYNPQTCLPFGWAGGVNSSQAGNTALNIIPAAYQNAVGMRYLNAFPLPNIASAKAATGAANFQPNRQGVTNQDDYDLRLDFVPNAKESVFFRASSGQDVYTVTDRLLDAGHDLPSGWGSGLNPQHPRQAAVGYTRVLSDNMINEFRFAYSRPYFGYEQPGFGTPEGANLGIPNANTDSLLGGMPLIGGWKGQLEYVGDYGPYVVKERGLQFDDAVTWTTGKHVVKFGMQLNHREVDFTQANNAKGYFWIDDNNSGGMPWGYSSYGTFTGNEVSELVGGFMGGYTIGVFNGFYRTNNWQNGAFVQDDWRVTRKLTLNLGLRYDYLSWPSEQSNRQSNFDPTTGTLVEAGTSAGWNSSLIDTPSHNFGPRAGFSYDLSGDGKTVVRGGYGLFYYLDRGGVGVQLSNNPDFNGTQSYYACNVVGGVDSCANGYRFTLSGAAPLGSLDPTVATGSLPTATVTMNPKALTSADNVIYYPKSSSNPRIQQWNLQVERAINSNTSLNVGYVGTHMDHLGTYFNANAPEYQTGNTWFPSVGAINEYAFIGSGNYNGLQVRLNSRMTKGLQYTIAYTWSHTLDNSNSPNNNLTGSRIIIGPDGTPLLNYNYGNSDTDIPHVLVASAIYELPFGRGRTFLSNAPKVVDYVLGGWQWNNIIQVMSGSPIDVYGDTSYGATSRPDYNGGCTVNPGSYVWLSCPAGAFTKVGPDAVGNLGRNYFHGPGYHTWDTGVTKNIALTERVRTELRLQIYNLTNSPQFQNPDGNLADVPTSNSGFGVENTIRQQSWRSIELGARVTF